MKTEFSKLILPMLVIVLAVTSAFTTVNSTTKKALAITPYEKQTIGGENQCVPRLESCSLTNNGVFCTVGQISGNPRLYEMDANDDCTIPLYKP